MSSSVAANNAVSNNAFQRKTSYDKSRMKVVLLEGIHQSAVDTFNNAGYSWVEHHTTALTAADLAKAVADAHLLGIRSRTQLTGEVFAGAEALLAVGCFCIGTNQVDLVAAQERGVAVFNAPFSNTRSVAELVVAEAIMLLRDLPRKNAAAHRGEWLKSAKGSFEVRGKTVGIVGYGHIGTQVGVLMEALGLNVVFYDIETKLSLGNAVQAPSLEALLNRADIVTLHVPETPQTHRMIGEAELAAMKPGAVLINASRGTVVDIDALTTVLEAGHLAGAAIDVFPVEPKSNHDEFQSPLRAFDNVILTPHVGGSTVEAQQNIGLEVAAKLVKYSDNGSTLTSVNFPEVSLPAHRGSHRLLHVHRNVPGVLSKVNDIFAQEGINIDAEYLQTNERIGYVVIDVAMDEGVSRLALQRLRAIDGTLRARVLY
ncbi:MAG: phosphoglycerate dehydrogenase [Candidatus Competibacterales bacterium]